MKKFSFDSVGSKFEITIWDKLEEEVYSDLEKNILEMCLDFEEKYSRFKDASYTSYLSKVVGEVEIDQDHKDLMEMLRIYKKVNELTDGKINPFIAETVSDYGYDEKYSFIKKEKIRTTSAMSDIVELKENSIILKQKKLLDLGAIGKGYLVDKIYEYLKIKSLEKFLVNGSGDIRYFSKTGDSISCGLEHPTLQGKVIGVISIGSGSLCASSLARRSWKEYNHYYDPIENKFSDYIIATFVISEEAKYADILASALFFADPRRLLDDFEFKYLIINKNLQIKKSEDFAAEIFG